MRALHAALDIQAALRDYGATVQRQWGVPFQLRLGLNTGPVVVGRIGDDLRMDYTAQGDTVESGGPHAAAGPAGRHLGDGGNVSPGQCQVCVEGAGCATDPEAAAVR